MKIKEGVIKKYLDTKESLEETYNKYEVKDTAGLLSEIKNLIKIVAFLLTPIGFGIFLIINNLQHSAKIQLILVVCNLVALFIWFVAVHYKKEVSKHEIKFKNNEKRKEYCTFLKVTNCKEESKNNNERVNKLVGQLKFHIKAYAFCLVIVYVAFLLDNNCVWQWAQCDNSNRIMESKSESTEWYFFFKILQDNFNLFSAAFLYLGFKVLYNRTLNPNNKRNLYYVSAIILCVIITLPYLHHTYFKVIPSLNNNNNLPYETVKKIESATKEYFDTIDKEAPKVVSEIRKLSDGEIRNREKIDKIKLLSDEYNKRVNRIATEKIEGAINVYYGETKINDTKKLSNIFALIIGSLNGLAMALLFGRYISMEHLINNLREARVYNWFSIGVLFLLPIYALAQPLFGVFEIDAFGNSKVFANCVFFICFLGKAFFLYFTYDFIKKRKLHYYLHMVITSHDIMKNFKDYFIDRDLEVSENNEDRTDKDLEVSENDEDRTDNDFRSLFIYKDSEVSENDENRTDKDLEVSENDEDRTDL